MKAFCKYARTMSKDVTTRPLCGDLSWVTQRSGLDKSFSDAAFQMAAGELAGPVQSSFGWHLIYLKDRRPRETKAPTPTKTTPPRPSDATPQAKPDEIAPGRTVPPPPPAVARKDPKRLTVTRETSLRVAIMTAKAVRGLPQQFTYAPDQAAEMTITVLNENSKDQQFFAPALLPLGLTVTPLGEVANVPADFSAVAEPASFLITLKPYEVSGQSISVDDYFKGLGLKRYRITWNIATFLTNLEARFPKVKDLPEFATLGPSLRDPGAVTSDVFVRDTQSRFARRRDLTVAIFEQPKAENKYYAQLYLLGHEKPVTIALNFQSQFNAARHFASLVLENFYDNLDFFEIEKGDFLLGGDPLRTGTGAPNGPLPTISNTAKLEHKEGTVSFVSRAIRQRGPVQGGQVGSIFLVCLKAHPEWDDQHVPFGEVVEGLDILKGLERSTTFRQVILLTEAEYRGTAPAPEAPATMADANPEAVIKTSKGELTVELYEDVARNTVVNFVRLALDGFYSKDAKGDGKQKFILRMLDAEGAALLLLTGSPTNDFDGNPGYMIRSEKNPRECIRGALVMAAEVDPQTQQYLPNTAGSQFFFALKDIPAYNYESALTVFGRVTKGLEVLDNLGEGDTLESIEITKKKAHSYTVQKIPLR